MSIQLGSNIIKKLFVGSIQVKKAYLGSDLVYINALPVTYTVDTGVSYVEEVEPGQTVLSPQTFTPTKSGYTFVGWREDTVASGTVISSKVMEDTPITLYAVFSQTFTLTKYNGSNTASTTNGNRYYNNGNIINPSFTLSENALSGWSKAGWTTDAAGYSATVADGGSVTLSANATYYSLYTASVTVTKYTNGAGAMATETKTRYANVHNTTTYSNPSFTLAEPDLSGWTKYGWADAADFAVDVANGGSVTLSANKTYYALYTQNITVTYYNNSSTASTSKKARYVRAGGSWSFSNPTFNLTVAAVSGWTVRGWSTSSAANGAISYNSATNFTRDSNVTLYASWTANVTVTYYNNSSTASTSTKAMYRGYKGDLTGATFNLSEASVSGWTARGWSTSSAANASITYNNATNFTRTSNCTLYASWTANVTVTYYNNSTTAGTSTKAMYRGYKGDVTAATFNLSEASVSGWTARGWSTSSAANAGITYNNATNFSRTSACTLYASWSKTVTVSYNGNGSTGGSTSASTGTAYRGYKGDVTNASISLRANGFSRTNYTFYRWALNSASGTQYKTGTSISLNTDATMYANWLETTVNFGYTGGIQTFAAKEGVTYQLKVWGAQGGNNDGGTGGAGGYAYGNVGITANTTFYVVVGGAGGAGSGWGNGAGGSAGYNGGGTGGKGVTYDYQPVRPGGGGGGGATHIGKINALLQYTPKTDLYIVAGGGGGSGGSSASLDKSNGGTGGGTSGGDSNNNGATGGTQSSGYAYGVGANGANGGNDDPIAMEGCGAGGGGLYGGKTVTTASGGGGGGSGYIGGVTSGSMSNGLQSGNGYATIVISSVS